LGLPATVITHSESEKTEQLRQLKLRKGPQKCTPAPDHHQTRLSEPTALHSLTTGLSQNCGHPAYLPISCRSPHSLFSGPRLTSPRQECWVLSGIKAPATCGDVL